MPAPPKAGEQPKPEDGKQPDVEMKPEEAKPVQDAPKQEYEIRKKTKKTSHALGVDSQSYALPQAARKNFYDKEF